MWNSKSFFFFFFCMRKQGKKHSVQDYKDHIIPWLQWLPTALRIKSKILHTATVPASALSTIQAASHFAPTIPRSVSNLFLCLLFQTNSDSSLPFALSLHFPGNVCFSSWARVLVSPLHNTREGLNTHVLPVLTNKEGLPKEAALSDGGHFCHFLGRVFFHPRSPAKPPSETERPNEPCLTF